MSEYFDNIDVGDEVYIECYTSLGQSSTGYRAVTAIEAKYDEDTGEPYRVIRVGSQKFDGRHGGALNERSMYYIAEDMSDE